MITQATKKLVDGEALNASDVEETAREIMSGDATPVQMAAFLTAMQIRGETADYLAAFARVMRDKALPFQRPVGPVLDTCGTGGDQSGTFNISTCAALVAAGAGVKVAKHGNRSMTSKCGSADVLAELGVRVDCDVRVMERALAEAGICFLFAQHYHSSMRHVAPVRRELGFRTIYNLLGPLANPAGASHQLIGVFRRDLVETHARVLAKLGSERALVVHGDDGLDEITTTTTTWAAELRNGEIISHLIEPEDYGVRLAYPTALAGGEPKDNARIIEAVLGGEPGPCADVVVLNAGAAIYVAGLSESIQEGVEQARAAIASGAAREKLRQLQEITTQP
jgi:anthranilate phosphoribosyltransferase